MKNILTGKQINEWAQQVNDLPKYWGCNQEWNDKTDTYKKVKGEFIAKKYKAILDLIIETKATVDITYAEIFIQYPNGQAKIHRDIFTDHFLLPLININVGFNSIAA